VTKLCPVFQTFSILPTSDNCSAMLRRIQLTSVQNAPTIPVVKKSIPAIISLCLIFFWIEAPLGTAQDAAQMVFDVGPCALHVLGLRGADWEPASASNAHHAALFEFVRKGDNINNWKELFTFQHGRRKAYPPSSQQYLDALKALREKECPGATVWNTIAQDENSILYEWQLTKPCGSAPGEAQAGVEQHEIARAIYEKDVVLIVHYAAKGHDLAPDVRTEWISRWHDAYVTRRP